MRERLSSWLSASLPRPVDRAIRGIGSRVEPWMRTRLSVVRYRARPEGSDTPRSVAVVDPQSSVEYFVRQFFGRLPPAELATVVPAFRVASTVSRLADDTDLVLARMPRLAATAFARRGDLCVPEAVGARLEVPTRPDDLAQASVRARRNLAKVRRNGLTAGWSEEPGAFDRFYDGMYVRSARERFGDLTYVRDRRRLRATFGRGGILSIRRGAEEVAAGLFELDRDSARWWVTGLALDNAEAVKIGALAALYYFAVELCGKRGIRWLDLGPSRPSLRDGVLSHKRSWGAALHEEDRIHRDIVVHWSEPNDDVLRFLERAPLVFRDGEELSGIGALTGERAGNAPTAAAERRRLAMPGLQRMLLLSSDPWETRSVDNGSDSVWLVEACASQRARETAVLYSPGG